MKPTWKSYQSTMSTRNGSATESLSYWMDQEMLKRKPSRKNGIFPSMPQIRFFDRLVYWMLSPR